MPDKLSVVGFLAMILYGPIAIAADHGTIPIVNFGSSIQTEQGGFFRCIGGRPDQIEDRLIAIGQPETDAWRIDLNDQAAKSGAGVLLPLFNETAAGKAKIQLGRNYHLALQLVGTLGSRRLRVELVRSSNPEAAGTLLGVVEPDQLDANLWREIRLPIPLVKNGQQQIGFVRILAEGAGTAWFAIDSIGLTRHKTRPIKLKQVSESRHPLRKALWFWETEKTLPDEHRTAALLELCRTQGLTDLYCQIPYSYEDGKIRLRLADEQRAFNAAAQSLGITTHALDGSPGYVFPQNHPRMIRLLAALGELNEQGAPNERYRAVHLDNEPYVLPGWKNDEDRKEIIRGYIELNKKLRRKADELGIEFGVDIPFWWDLRDREGNAKFTYDTKTGKQPILEALFPLLDNVGIMSYRVRMTGPNGLVFHCLNEFELGEKYGVDVFTAMELGTGDDVDAGTTFGAYPWPYFHRQLSSLEKVLAHTPGCAGWAIHYAKPFAEAMR